MSVAMGRVSFTSTRIPVAGPEREVIRETVEAGGRSVEFTAATIGNPHCVVLRAEVTAEEARSLGPDLETASLFPNRTNVQFMQVLDRRTVRIEIWERGAGYTLASGSSASACAAVAVKLGLCDPELTVCMPGGNLTVEVAPDFSVTQTGPVTAIARGTIAADLLAGFSTVTPRR